MIENLVSSKFREDFSDIIHIFRSEARAYVNSEYTAKHYKKWAMQRYHELKGYALCLYRGEHISNKKYKTILSELEIIKDSLYEQ